MSYFQHKVVLVTGGSAGLGQAIARAFAQEGARVVITARGRQRLSQTASQLQDQGGDVTWVAADITQQSQVDDLLAQILQQFQDLHVLVNNAGQSARGWASQTSPEQHLELLQLNFLGLVRCSRAALPHLTRSQGHLVNMGSLSSKVATPYLGAYPASKFAVAAYSQQLRLELQPKGVHVLLVCPGPISRQDSGPRYDQQADDLPARASGPGGGAKLRALSPDWVAARILRACRQRQPELVLPSKARLLFALAQLCPSWGDWILKKMA